MSALKHMLIAEHVICNPSEIGVSMRLTSLDGQVQVVVAEEVAGYLTEDPAEVTCPTCLDWMHP